MRATSASSTQPASAISIFNKESSDLNAARGNLKTKIHKGIYINQQFLTSGCSCKKDGFYAYELALQKTGVWPLEGTSLVEAKYPSRKCSIACKTSNITLPTTHVISVPRTLERRSFRIRSTMPRVLFDGLYLDSMNVAGKRNWDEEYDNHCHFKNWTCRVWYDQPTCYFSWLARKQQPDYHERERESRKRKRIADNSDCGGSSDAFGSRKRKIFGTR